MTADAAALVEQARAEFRNGELNAAAGKLEHAARVGPLSAAGAHLAGLIALARGDGQRAHAAFMQALELDPNHYPAHNDLGNLYGRVGNVAEARRSFERALALRPDEPGANFNLAMALRMLGDSEGAVLRFSRVVELLPGHPQVHRQLGELAHLANRDAEACEHYQRHLTLNPECADTWSALGTSLYLGADFDAARQCFEKALSYDPAHANAKCNLGVILQLEQRLDDAGRLYTEVLAIQPAHTEALAGMGSIHEFHGRYAEGVELIRPQWEKGARSPELALIYGKLLRRTGELAAAEEIISIQLAAGGTARNRSRLGFVLGAIQDRRENYAAAFSTFETANRLRAVHFDHQAFEQSVDELLKVFDTRGFEALPRLARDKPSPVLIVGMPRSGTSLLEQILAQHPAVRARGELPDLPRLAVGLEAGHPDDVGYPQCLPALDADALRELRAVYLEALGNPAVGVVAIDKLPTNFLHLGLVELVFPGARILHCARHPLDTVVSIYLQDFAGDSMRFGYSLDDIVCYYRRYRELMAHWDSVLSLPVLTVRYEAMVADMEAETRRVLSFLGLDWHPDCARFFESSRVTYTASHAQVRKPIYRSSIDRHRHYADQLGSLSDALREFL